VLSFSSQAVRGPTSAGQASRVIGSQIGQFLKRKQAEESATRERGCASSLVQMSSTSSGKPTRRTASRRLVQGPTYVDYRRRCRRGGWGELRGMFQARAPFRDFEFGRPWPDGSIRVLSVSGEAALWRRRRLPRLPRRRREYHRDRAGGAAHRSRSPTAIR